MAKVTAGFNTLETGYDKLDVSKLRNISKNVRKMEENLRKINSLCLYFNSNNSIEQRQKKNGEHT